MGAAPVLERRHDVAGEQSHRSQWLSHIGVAVARTGARRLAWSLTRAALVAAYLPGSGSQDRTIANIATQPRSRSADGWRQHC